VIAPWLRERETVLELEWESGLRARRPQLTPRTASRTETPAVPALAVSRPVRQHQQPRGAMECVRRGGALVGRRRTLNVRCKTKCATCSLRTDGLLASVSRRARASSCSGRRRWSQRQAGRRAHSVGWAQQGFKRRRCAQRGDAPGRQATQLGCLLGASPEAVG